jgi:hypothetical protein
VRKYKVAWRKVGDLNARKYKSFQSIASDVEYYEEGIIGL